MSDDPRTITTKAQQPGVPNNNGDAYPGPPELYTLGSIARACPRCFAPMKPSTAFAYTGRACLGYPVDAKLVECLKCPACGYSETEGPKLKILDASAQMDPLIAQGLEQKKVKFYSMGCLADSVTCTVCGETFTQQPWCEHLDSAVTQICTDTLAQCDVLDVFKDAVLGVTYPPERTPMPSKSPFPSSIPHRNQISPVDVALFRAQHPVIYTRETRGGKPLTFYCLLDGSFLVEHGLDVPYRGSDLDKAIEAYDNA